ncbi:MAG: hypothetical protein ACR2N1_08175 [Rubripirellula sp.]
MRLFALVSTVGFALTALVVLPVSAQGLDPFGGKNDPRDPFAKQPPPAGTPVNIALKVVDHAGVPVAGAGIDIRSYDSQDRARSIELDFATRLMHTNENGVATWRTTDQQLGQLAKLNRGRVVFTIVPSENSMVPRMLREYKLEEINQDDPLEFKGRDGIRFSGKVIGKQDQRPVENARVYITKNGFAFPTRTDFYTRTDPNGAWSLVVPRVDAVQVVCGGTVEGYDLENEKKCRKVVEVAAETSATTVPTFEVKQLSPIAGQVVDENGKAVSDASVTSGYPYWWNKDFVRFESLGSRVQSNAKGGFAFLPERPNWDSGFVRAQAMVDGVACAGRVSIAEPIDKRIQVRLRPLTRLVGKLSDGDKAVAGTKLVIFETVEVSEKPPRWVSVGHRGRATTDAAGAFEFLVERGVHYFISTEDQSGRLTPRYRTAGKLGSDDVTADIDLRTAL